MMKLLCGAGEEPAVINPFVFQQFCGAIFTGNEEEPINGETQEDAHEFMIKLLDQLREEQPDLNFDELFAAKVAERQACECGGAKTFVEENCNFNIPGRYQSRTYNKVDLGVLTGAFCRDKSKFHNYRCEKCGQSGERSAKDGWKGKRMT
jgi:uncharacterized UBP type Zn finger protein